MPKFELCLQAECQNVKEIKRKQNTPLFLETECGKCGEKNPNMLELLPEHEEDIPGSRGQTNMNFKCKFCNGMNTIDLKQEKAFDGENRDEQAIFTIEVRGSQKINDWRFSEIELISCHGFQLITGEFDDLVEYDEIGETNINFLDAEYTVK